jgi:hypothetical protein
VIGVIVMIMSSELKYDQQVIKAGNEAREQASQIAGVDSVSGQHVINSADLQLISSGGKTTSALVVKLPPGGAYANYFGLQEKDQILEFEYQGFSKSARELEDDANAKEQLAETYQRQGSLTVLRNGQKLKLPAPKTVAASPPAAPAPTAAPAAPADGSASPSDNSRKSPLQKQLDAISEPR